MPVVTFHAFWCSLGSLLVATLGAPLWIAPRFFSFGRNLVGWLMAAVTVRALTDAPGLVLSADETATLRQLETFGLLASMTLFAEAARSSAHVIGRRPTSAWWHVPVGLASVAHLVFAISPGLAAPLGRAAMLTWVGPVALTVFAIAGLWQALVRHAGIQIPQRRTVLKVAVLGFALSNFFALAAMPGERDFLATGTIWAAVTGLSALALTVPEFRRQVALIMVASIVSVPFLGPFVAGLNVHFAGQRFESRAREIAEGARSVPRLAFRPGEISPSEVPTAERILTEHLRSVRRRDSALRDAYFWTLRGDSLWRFSAEGNYLSLSRYRRASAEEQRRATENSGTFFVRIPASDDGGIVAAHAPVVSGGEAEGPVWLAIEYPEALWSMQLENARRNGASMVALFAVLMAVGLVLGSVQAVENARHTRLQRSEGANRAKREFLAFLSHELRTPMQSVLGRAELLQRSPLPAAAQNEVGAILEDGRLLLRLVTDLLDLGAIEAGRLQLQPAPCLLHEALESLMASYQARAESRGLMLNLEIAPNVPVVVLADEGRLRQMLGNFLSNGLKYTERGSVTMLVRSGNPLEVGTTRTVEFVVRDTGPGVPPAQIDRLFSLFTRVDAGNVRREGTGVGLALVRRLCKLMGGEVHAANRPEGGAEFTLRLNFPLASRSDLPRSESPQAPAVSAHGRRALVVEDNPSARKWLADAMTALGFSVQAVADGEAALALDAGGIDVVMLDVNLPGRDGMAIARALRVRQPALRIVGCSAEAFAATRDAALAAGMDAYLTKPISLAELEKAVGRPGAMPGDLFARLYSKDTTLRARAQLRSDWSRLRERTELALAEGDARALRSLGHYLKSTALLTQDDELAALCEEFGNGALANVATGPEFLAAVENHIASWPA